MKVTQGQIMSDPIATSGVYYLLRNHGAVAADSSGARHGSVPPRGAASDRRPGKFGAADQLARRRQNHCGSGATRGARGLAPADRPLLDRNAGGGSQSRQDAEPEPVRFCRRPGTRAAGRFRATLALHARAGHHDSRDHSAQGLRDRSPAAQCADVCSSRSWPVRRRSPTSFRRWP